MVNLALPTVPKPAPGDHTSIAAQYAKAKAARDEEERRKRVGGWLSGSVPGEQKSAAEKLNEWKEERFKREWWWMIGLFVFFL